MSFAIATLAAGQGVLGICPAPGRYGDYTRDVAGIISWAPALVVSMTEMTELERIGAGQIASALAQAGVGWAHLPVCDFGAPKGDTLARWSDVSAQVRGQLDQGGRVLVHCFGGCGRSGMVILRILVELGEDGPAALARLRRERACAVETKAQMNWALQA